MIVSYTVYVEMFNKKNTGTKVEEKKLKEYEERMERILDILLEIPDDTERCVFFMDGVISYFLACGCTDINELINGFSDRAKSTIKSLREQGLIDE